MPLYISYVRTDRYTCHLLYVYVVVERERSVSIVFSHSFNCLPMANVTHSLTHSLIHSPFSLSSCFALPHHRHTHHCSLFTLTTFNYNQCTPVPNILHTPDKCQFILMYAGCDKSRYLYIALLGLVKLRYISLKQIRSKHLLNIHNKWLVLWLISIFYDLIWRGINMKNQCKCL